MLYNFYTATAGTAPQSQTTQYSTASGSICPANWRLPTGLLGASNFNGDFGLLDQAFGGTGNTQTGTPTQLATLWLSTGAWRGVFNGYYTTTFLVQGTSGSYWSSSVGNAAYGYNFFFSSTSVSPGTNYYSRGNGNTIRCVL